MKGPRQLVVALLAGVVVATLILSRAAFGQSVGVVADPTIPQFAYSSLQGLSDEQRWTLLDGAEYWSVPRAAPPEYYSTVDSSSATALRQSLHARVHQGHEVVPYTHSSRPGQAGHSLDVWDVIVLADAHPEQPGRVLDMYLNGEFDRLLAGVSSGHRYDREHAWPKSLGFPDMTTSNPAYSDCHHLVAAFQSYNSSRSNKPYGNGPEDAQRRKPTFEAVGRGGGNHDEPESSNYSFSDRWQTWIGRRGDVARAMFYMDLRYDGAPNEADLVLTDDISKIVQINAWQQSGKAHMGLLADLIRWHAEDPVDDQERRRNSVVFIFQGNRNPFIDHPEWVGVIFGGAPVVPLTPQPGDAGPLPDLVWINELHYDNEGDDADEFVEVCGRAGTTLTGWTIVAYNGNGGKSYKTVGLTGVLPSERDGFGTMAVSFDGLQNGPPDGVALVNAAGQLIQFLSYEGRFTASDGPASEVPSTDLEVSESATTPKGHSPQWSGSQWLAASPSSRGTLNQGQATAPVAVGPINP